MSSSIMSSGDSEKRWVSAMEKNFPKNQSLNIDFNTQVCVFKVLSQQKPEAYSPTNLGLGPLHHLRPDLYPMHSRKLAAITEFLTPDKLKNFHLAVQALLPLEPLIRASYDQYLDLDIATLAWIFAIDALYLLYFFKNYPLMKQLDLAGDVLMLENQIPFVLLHKILDVLELDISPDQDLQAFLEDQSPLALNTNGAAASQDAHLLHRMYQLIVNYRGLVIAPTVKMFSNETVRIQVNDISQSVQFLADQGLPGAGTAGQILSFASQIPWGRITAIFKKQNDTSTISDEIDIPSVSQMTSIAKIKFIRAHGGIRDITLDVEQKKFYLPSMRVSGTSETVLRNLVAYEAASAQAGATLEVAEYMDLMCGIIDSAKDVKILKEAGIVESDLDDKQIATIFNGIRKSEKKKGDDKTNVEAAIESVNNEFSSLMRVKVKRSLEKYGYACFKFTSVVITIAVALLLILQAYCTVFGCARWFDKTQSVGVITTPFPFALFI